jgi:2,6-dihydroxypseudooxynicotine hydrolase
VVRISDNMTPEEVEEFKEHQAGRFTQDGVEYLDLVNILWPAIKTWDDWMPEFTKVGDSYLSIAEKAEREGNTVTAGEAFWKASMYYHYGQFMEWHRPEKADVVSKKVEAYKRAAPLVSPAAERVEGVKLDGVTLPGYLRLPVNAKRPPLVVLIGGLESTKEEYYTYERLLLNRGMATFSFDGPGQNEVWPHMKARYDFETPTAKVVDYLETRGDILDTERLAVFGRSLGGYYSLRAAAFEKRFKACVAWSSVDFNTYDAHTPGMKDGWMYVSGTGSWEEAKEFFKKFTLKGVAERITCPLYFLHGGKDPIFPTETAKYVAAAAKGPVELNIEPEGNHCAHNIGHLIRPKMADWLAKTLRA